MEATATKKQERVTDMSDTQKAIEAFKNAYQSIAEEIACYKRVHDFLYRAAEEVNNHPLNQNGETFHETMDYFDFSLVQVDTGCATDVIRQLVTLRNEEFRLTKAYQKVFYLIDSNLRPLLHPIHSCDLHDEDQKILYSNEIKIIANLCTLSDEEFITLGLSKDGQELCLDMIKEVEQDVNIRYHIGMNISEDQKQLLNTASFWQYM